jgi:AraC-type DNA-binding domain-containing proteins
MTPGFFSPMNLSTFQPGPSLAPFIKCYNIIESRSGITNTVLPGTSLAMAFRYSGETSFVVNHHATHLPAAVVSGLQKSARQIHYAQDTSNFVVLFKETGLAAFFKQPLHELFTQSVSLEIFFKASEIENIQEQLAESKNHEERVAVVESFLLSKLNSHRRDTLIETAIHKIYAAQGNIKISDLLQELYISKDAFEKRFRKTAGATPKQFAHIVKMNAVIRKIRNDHSFLGAAFDNGFYDQPHFNKDFKMFTGQTPTHFLQSARFW